MTPLTETSPNASSLTPAQSGGAAEVLPSEPPRKSPWSRKAQLARSVWALVKATIWHVAPGSGARAWLLRRFGARIGHGVRIDRRVHIEIPWHLDIGDHTVVCRGAILYCLGQVTVGQGCLVGPFVHLCAGTHDYTDPRFTLLREPITIGDRCVLMSDAFVAPGVTAADGTVLRPRCGLFRDSEPDAVYQGNPGKPIGVEGEP